MIIPPIMFHFLSSRKDLPLINPNFRQKCELNCCLIINFVNNYRVFPRLDGSALIFVATAPFAGTMFLPVKGRGQLPRSDPCEN